MTNLSPSQFPLGAHACVGVLLAAGAGRRFDSSLPSDYPQRSKLLARLADGTPVAQASALSLVAVLARVVAVVPPEADLLRRLLAESGCEVIECADADAGMGASLAAGARFLMAPGTSPRVDTPAACLVALADMPWIMPTTLARTAELTREHRIVAPAWNGTRGHPVGFQAACFAELARLTGDAGARGLIVREGIHTWECGDPGVVRDIDTLADLTG